MHLCSTHLISLILDPPFPITEPITSLEIVISVVRVGTIPGLLVVEAWWPKEAAEFANEAKVAIANFRTSNQKKNIREDREKRIKRIEMSYVKKMNDENENSDSNY